jgi:hypothetical protein
MQSGAVTNVCLSYLYYIVYADALQIVSGEIQCEATMLLERVQTCKLWRGQ